MNTPTTIGIIMDGNRRWARAHNLPEYEGHRLGYEKFKDILSWMKDAGIKNAIVYALSTENLKRSEQEVSYLFDLFRTVIRERLEEVAREQVRVVFAGDRSLFPEDLARMASELEAKTAPYTEHTLVIAAPYGGRAEIISAVNYAIEKGTPVTEETFNALLWTHGVPDPDLIIRTGGEQRLSNFLPWQSTYAEFFFTETLWPDFSQEEFLNILREFGTRERRHGT
jgi:undecaprenyl diphosphate synthase